MAHIERIVPNREHGRVEAKKMATKNHRPVRTVLGNIGDWRTTRASVAMKAKADKRKLEEISTGTTALTISECPPQKMVKKVILPDPLPLALPKGVVDMDKMDVDDPQMCSDNVIPIYWYLRQLELEQNIKPDFLKGAHVTPRMRAVLINWLSEVHIQFKLLQETMYLAVAILDRFLSTPEGMFVRRQKLQLVGVAALLVACKYEEMYVPEINDFVFITDNAYTGGQIRDMEVKILTGLKFELGRPLSINFLRRISKTGNVTSQTHTLAKYILETAMTQYSVAHAAPSLQAAASLLIAIRLIKEEETGGQEELRLKDLWTTNLAYYSGYTLDQVVPVVQLFSEFMASAHNSKFQAAFGKYNTSSKQKVALLPATHSDVLERMAHSTRLN